MDRLTGQLDRSDEHLSHSEDGVVGFGDGDEHLVEQSRHHARIDRELFELSELDVLYRADDATLWTFMRPNERPSFTPSMLHDFESWQRLIVESFGSGQVPLDYLVLGSRAPGVFCFGGDLSLFEQLILPQLRQRNPQARQQAVDTLRELARLGGELRSALLANSLRHHLDT